VAVSDKHQHLSRQELEKELARLVDENEQLKELISEILAMLKKKFK
jgi:hypothetical protein